MALAHSTLTLGEIDRNPVFWTGLYGPISRGNLAGHEFTDISAQEQARFVVESSGISLYLKGLLYEDRYPAHITLTPDDQGEWTYFHFTLETDKRTAYYELQIIDEEGTAGFSQYTAVEHKKKKVNTRAETYWKPGDVPVGLTEDLIVIIVAFIEGAHGTIALGGVPG